MIPTLVIASLVLAVFSAFLCWQVTVQRRMLAQLMESEAIEANAADPELVLTLRVLDPIGVAKRESRSARVLADKLPVMVRKMVYQEVMKELEAELADREIDVEMQIEYR